MQVPFAKDSFLSAIPVNWYPAADTDKEVIMMAAPGLLEKLKMTAAGPVRGFKVARGLLFVVCGDTVYYVSPAFAVTTVGTIGTDTGRVWIEFNGVQVAFCDGQDMWVYTFSTGLLTQVTDADFPGASCLTYQDGYGAFINPNTAQFYLSALYDFTSITATDYASAEGWPDDLTSILMNYRELWLFGSETIEIWYNAGSSPFPFARIQGGLIEQGCIAPASTAKGDNVVYWLAATRQVMTGVGYQPKIISTRKLEREFDSFDRVDDALGFVQVFEGHTFYWLIFPTAGKTYVYDAATQVWHERKSFPRQGRHRANCYAYFEGLHLVGDYSNGTIYEMSRSFFDDNGEELVAQLETPEIRAEGKRQFFSGIEVVFDGGLEYLSRAPKVMLQYSNDKGKTWSNELHAPLANQGEYGNRSIWRRLGSGYGRIYRLSISDPVPRDILSVNMV